MRDIMRGDVTMRGDVKGINSELQKKFRQFAPENSRSPYSMFGISCDNGWYQILLNLMTALDRIGWDGKICQIKEKFGGLRFYVDHYGDPDITWAVETLIEEAERESFHTCEHCGIRVPWNRRTFWEKSHGQYRYIPVWPFKRYYGWSYTLCGYCALNAEAYGFRQLQS